MFKSNLYDRQCLVEIETKLEALDFRINHDMIDLEQAEAYYDLRKRYNERIQDLTELIKEGR